MRSAWRRSISDTAAAAAWIAARLPAGIPPWSSAQSQRPRRCRPSARVVGARASARPKAPAAPRSSSRSAPIRLRSTGAPPSLPRPGTPNRRTVPGRSALRDGSRARGRPGRRHFVRNRHARVDRFGRPRSQRRIGTGGRRAGADQAKRRDCNAGPHERSCRFALRDCNPGLRLRQLSPMSRPCRFHGRAPVAQLDRAPDYEFEGRTFESFRARHFPASMLLEPSPALAVVGAPDL